MAKFDLKTPDGIRDYSIDRFNQLAGEKYDKGQSEHGGLLARTVTFERMEEEILDMWHYLMALRLKHEERDLDQRNLARRLNDQIEALKNEIYRIDDRE